MPERNPEGITESPEREPREALLSEHKQLDDEQKSLNQRLFALHDTIRDLLSIDHSASTLARATEVHKYIDPIRGRQAAIASRQAAIESELMTD